MKTVRNWGDLKEFGIDCLTGEACALSIRALCDLTEQGQANVCEFLGIQPAAGVFADSWNGGTAVSSCFLPYEILPGLAAFLMIKSGCLGVAHIAQDGLYGIEPSDDMVAWNEWVSNQGDIVRTYTPINSPGNWLSCVHQMSGRSQ